MNNIPQDLDWIEVLAACSTRNVFVDLRRGAEEDARKVTAKREDGVSFRVESNPDGSMFTVFQNESLGQGVRFYLAKNFIKIKGVGSGDLTVTLTLNNEGRCKLRVYGEELEQWQVRKMALEKLFFGPLELAI